MKKIKLFVVFLAFLSLALLPGCANSKLKKHVKYLNQSMDKVVKINTISEMKDQNVLVYKYQKNVTIKDNVATVETITSTLSSNFKLEDKVSNETGVAVKRDELIKIDLNKKLLNSFNVKDGILTAEISQENISQVLNYNVKINGVANIVITYDKKNVTKIEITFKTDTLKDVVIISNYNY